MGVQELESAMYRILELAEEEADESAYHAWFLQHPVVMQLLGYTRVISEPTLVSQSGESPDRRPDFMVQLSNGLWEIVEIKRADTPVLLPAERRRDSYAEFRKYVSQCHEYSAYFEDSANRRAFESEYATTIQQTKVKSVLIAGWGNEDRALVHDIITREPLLDFMTYKELFSRIENGWRLTEGEHEGLPGINVSMRLVLLRPARDGQKFWIADIGTDENIGRVSLFLTGTTLHVEFRDDGGALNKMQVVATEALGRDVYLGFELGLDERFAVGRVWIDDRVETHKWAPAKLTKVFPLSWVMGSDMTGEGRGCFLLARSLVFKGTVLLRDRIQMRKGIKGFIPMWSHFREGAVMHTEGHPRFPRYIKVIFGGETITVRGPSQQTTNLKAPEGRGPTTLHHLAMPSLVAKYLAQPIDDDSPIF